MDSTWSGELIAAAKTLSDYCTSSDSLHQSASSPHSRPSDRIEEAIEARRKILSIASRLQTTLLANPADLIQQLSGQLQLLACLKWLSEFQVLACIPLHNSLLIKEVADVAGVPEQQLRRVMRAVATVGILHEPQAGYIAHTPLSAQFVTNLRNLDAVTFLASTVAPTALHMAQATGRPGSSSNKNKSAYAILSETGSSFLDDCKQNPRLQRQWTAFWQCGADSSEEIVLALTALNWRALGTAKVVDVCADSVKPAESLIAVYPSLQMTVQLNSEVVLSPPKVKADSNRNGRQEVTLENRLPGTPQPITDAAVYILRFAGLWSDMSACILAELNIHLAILAANQSRTLLLAPPLLPEHGQAVGPELEAKARLQDLCLHQLTNDGAALELSDLVDLVISVHDHRGSLIVVNRLHSNKTAAVIALAVKYAPYPDLSATTLLSDLS
ncbi:hypothetical protein DV738_g926, partial [Chaetothyriales sp. CBS 135597]